MFSADMKRQMRLCRYEEANEIVNDFFFLQQVRQQDPAPIFAGLWSGLGQNSEVRENPQL